MTTDIIIPTFNQESFTVKCLQSIKQYTDDYRIVWVDNGSTEASRVVVMKELERHSKYLTIWIDKNCGFVKAVNAGINACHSPFLVIQNNDTEVTPNWLERLMMPMKDSNVVVSGPLTDADGSWQGWRNVRSKLLNDMPNLQGLSALDVSKTLHSKYGDRIIQVKMIAFFSALFRRSIFDQIGILDECFQNGLADDDDLCMRIAKFGKKVVFIPSSFVYHHHRTTFKSLYSQQEIKTMQDKNLNIYKRKHNLI